MILARPNTMSVLAGAIALAGLAGCAMDDEKTVRAEVDQWVDIGTTLSFHSEMTCTAAVFGLSQDSVKSAAPHAVTIAEGLSLLRRGGVAAFESPTHSPADISAQLMSADLGLGNGVLASGLGGGNCLNEPWRALYQAAIQRPGAVLIFKRDGNALVIVDRAAGQVFFARGDV